VRGARQHFTHSKVMAWVAADRMSRAVRTHPTLKGPAERWEALRETIHADVLARAYDRAAARLPSSMVGRRWMPACS